MTAGDGDLDFSLNLIGQRLKDRYRVVEALGEGGMGRVYLAVDEDLSRRVVLKVPHVELLGQPKFRERFDREIKSLIGLEHPHVVKVLDAGTVRGVPFAVLQYLPGGNLEDQLKARSTPMDVETVLSWLPDVARALDYIHSKGFVHRDVKPGNIMFDDQGNSHVGDFGIARVLGEVDAALTQTGMVPGSPGYMPPEVGRGEPVTPAYDQYALAVVVYKALSGRLPHEADSAMAMLTRKVTVAPTPLAAHAPHVPKGVVSVVMHALASEPVNRYASCEAFARAFAEAAAGQAPKAPGSTGRERLAMAETAAIDTSGVARRGETAPPAPAAAGRAPRLERILLVVLTLALLGVGAWQFRGLLTTRLRDLGVPAPLDVAGAPSSGDEGASRPESTSVTDGAEPATASALDTEAHGSDAVRPGDDEGAEAAPHEGATTASDEGSGAPLGEGAAEPPDEAEGAAASTDAPGSEEPAPPGGGAASDVPPPEAPPDASGGGDGTVAPPAAADEHADAPVAADGEAGAPTVGDENAPAGGAEDASAGAHDDMPPPPTGHAAADPDGGTAASAPDPDPVPTGPPPSPPPPEPEVPLPPTDVLAPRVVTVEPVDGASVAVGPLVLRGRVAEDDLAAVEACDRPCEIDGAAFTCACVLPEGRTELTLTLRDGAGNLATHFVSYVASRGGLTDAGRNARGFPVFERVIDGARVVEVPAGSFSMGSSAGGRDERPVHEVSVSSFLMDEREVSWEQYYRYMEAHDIRIASMPSRWDPVAEEPVVNLDWSEAAAYCAWVGGRLPTEAEWEYAARGPGGAVYPWGDDWANGRANLGGAADGHEHAAPVGSFPAGASPFGLLDMAGNVAEWTADWYASDYYAGSPAIDPRGPPSGTSRVVRGGHWNQQQHHGLRAANRARADPGAVFANFGVRCAMDPR